MGSIRSAASSQNPRLHASEARNFALLTSARPCPSGGVTAKYCTEHYLPASAPLDTEIVSDSEFCDSTALVPGANG